MPNTAEQIGPAPEELKSAETKEQPKSQEASQEESNLPEGVEKVGDSFELTSANGTELPAVFIGRSGENVNLIGLNEIMGRASEAPRVALLVDGQLKAREGAQKEIADLKGNYNKNLELLLVSQGVDGVRAELIKKVAEAQQEQNLAHAVTESNPSLALSQSLSELLAMSNENLVSLDNNNSLLSIESKRRTAEQDLISAEGPNAIKTAEKGRLLSALEAGTRRMELNKDADPTLETAKAEGFVELMSSPLYEAGAEAVRDRMGEIDAELKAFDNKKDSERTSADEINVNMLWDERKRHMGVLPTLEKFENLQKKMEEVDQRKNKAVEDHKAEIAKSYKSKKFAILNRVGRIKALNALAQARDGFAKFWENSPWDEDAGDERDDAQTRLETLESEIEALKNEQALLDQKNVSFDFDPDAELDPAKNEIYDHLITLAKDGDADAVEEYVSLRLNKKTLSEQERSILERVAISIADKDWIPATETPPAIISELAEATTESNPEATTEQVVDLLLERYSAMNVAEQATFIEKSKAFIESSEASPEARKAHQEFLDQAWSADKSFDNLKDTGVEEINQFGETADTANTTKEVAKELGLQPAELNMFKNYYEALVPALKFQGLTKEAFNLPKSWSELTNVKENKVAGWFKRTFGLKTKRQKMFDNIVNAYYEVKISPQDVPSDVLKRLQQSSDAMKKNVRFQIPGNL